MECQVVSQVEFFSIELGPLSIGPNKKIIFNIFGIWGIPYVSEREWKGCVYRARGKTREHTTLPFPF